MSVLIGWTAGWLGGVWHLGFTALRARSLTSGSVGPSLLLLPVALAGPALAVLGTLQVAPGAVWAVLVGLFLAKLTLVGPMSRRMEGAWTR